MTSQCVEKIEKTLLELACAGSFRRPVGHEETSARTRGTCPAAVDIDKLCGDVVE